VWGIIFKPNLDYFNKIWDYYPVSEMTFVLIAKLIEVSPLRFLQKASICLHKNYTNLYGSAICLKLTLIEEEMLPEHSGGRIGTESRLEVYASYSVSFQKIINTKK